MSAYSLETVEIEFEKAPDPAARWFIRLRTPDDGTVIMEVREREHVNGSKHFFRAEARPVWRERAGWLSFEKGEFHSLLNAVQVTVDTTEGVAKFGPKGNIAMTMVGSGLGSYVMSRVIHWLKQKYPEAHVLPGKLAASQADDPVNRERRNRFYEKHNFDFDWYEEGISGSFFKARAGDLEESENKVEEFTIDDLASDHCAALGKLRRLTCDIDSVRRIRREKEEDVARYSRILAAVVGVFILFIVFPGLPRALHDIALAMAIR